jgi:hypothetical protein
MDDILLEQILNESKEVVALYGGGFKPPTAGHFLVVKKALEDNPDIDVFKVLVGGGSRDGIEQHEAVLAWEIFSEYLPMKVEVIPAKNPPIKEIYNFAKDNPEKTIYFVIGGREGREDDIKDIAQRTKGMDKYQNVSVKAITTPDEGMSGTNARLALKKGSEEEFFKFLPSELSDKEKNEIFQMMIPNISEELNEGMLDKYLIALKSKFNNFINGLKQEGQETKEAFIKIINAVRSGEKLSKEERTEVGNQLKDTLKLAGFTAASILPGGVIYLLLTRIPALKTSLTPSSFITEDVIDKTDFVLPRGKKMILQAEDEDYDRGLIVELTTEGGYKMNYWYGKDAKIYPVEVEVDGESIKPDAKEVYMKFHPELNENDPKKGTGKKPKDSSRRLYTDEDPKDTVGVKFRTKEDIVDTLNKKSFKAKSHARQSQIINLIHQRVRAAYSKAKDPETKARLKRGLDYITKRKEASKKKTQRLKKQKNENVALDHDGKAAPFGSGYDKINENTTYSNYIDYKQEIRDLTKHMLEKGMNIVPLPKVIFKHNDEENAQEFLGKTAYYDPNDMTIVLYTEGRHPKDVVRSFSHEMIHHIQNLEGRLEDINTTNTTEDDHLNDIEREAYSDGNMTFRNWTDGKDGTETTSLNEGKYDSLVTKLAGFTLNAWKGDFEDGQSKGYFELEVGPGKEFDYPHLMFKYIAKASFVDYFKSGGVARPKKKMPEVELKYFIPSDELPRMWEQISGNIRNVIRHEIEHLMQSGPNVKQGKEMEDDSSKRDELRTGKKPWWKIWRKKLGTPDYYKLEKEVDANLQGLYLKAKKTRQPLKKVIDLYLKYDLNLPVDEQEEVKRIWAERAPALNIPLEEDKKNKPYKHKHGFNDKLGKDPFGLNSYARELAQGLEEELNNVRIPEEEVVPSKEKVMNYKIYSDMDGVLVDFDKRFMEFSNGVPPREYEKKHGKEGFWDLVDNKTGVRFWRGMDYMPDGETYWNYIQKYNPIFLSSPSRSETSRIGKRMWVKDNHPDTKLVLAQAFNKKNYADENAILIDDRESNIEQWKAAGGIGILHTSASDTIKQLKALGL